MTHMVVGVFDDYERTGDSIIRLKEVGFDNNQLSLIGLDNDDPETLERYTGDEEIESDISDSIGGLSGAVATHLDYLSEAEVSGVGHVLLSGPVADSLSSSKYFRGEALGGLLEAFKDIGFKENSSIKYSDLINDGRAIIFVFSNEKSDQEIIDIFNEFGALETDSLENNIIENY